MESNTYCGASDEHVHYNNQELKAGHPIKLFGIDGNDEKTIWLDMKNCSGTIDASTFSLLPNVEYISIEKCDIQCFNAFSSLEKLSTLQIKKSIFPFEQETFEGNKGITSLYIQDMKSPINASFKHLNNLESISFESCSFENINKNMFSGLAGLKRLSISHCKIDAIESDAFADLKQLEGLNIRDSEIGEISFDSFNQLTNLQFLSFHHNKVESETNYTIFEQMKTLDTIHFDSNIYTTLNFDGFSQLQNVKIGYHDGEEDPNVDEIIDTLKSKNIKTEYVFCGTIDYDSDEMEECY